MRSFLARFATRRSALLGLFGALVLGVGFSVFSPGGAYAFPDISPAKAAQLIKARADVVVLDIRTPGEYRAGHIAGAVNVDYYDDGYRAALAKLDPAKTYIMHCKRGGRSSWSLKAFRDLGFTDIRHMRAGMDGWLRAGLPVVRP
ncbi:MAG: rhodanese-like domain-containing protein [Pseudomonadota bacterium]